MTMNDTLGTIGLVIAVILMETFPWNVILVFAIWAVCRMSRRPG